MDLDSLPLSARAHASAHAVTCVVAAICSRLLEREADIDTSAKEILEMALGSVRKFNILTDGTLEQAETARAIMEAVATELVTASAHTARQRSQSRR